MSSPQSCVVALHVKPWLAVDQPGRRSVPLESALLGFLTVRVRLQHGVAIEVVREPLWRPRIVRKTTGAAITIAPLLFPLLQQQQQQQLELAKKKPKQEESHEHRPLLKFYLETTANNKTQDESHEHRPSSKLEVETTAKSMKQ